MNIGYIGLGHLGKTIANRLIETGSNLTVWNRTPEKADGMNATVAASPEEVANATDIIFLCLFDSRAVAEVLLEEHGLLEGNVAGKVIIDLTTNHFQDASEFHGLCEDCGAFYLEAPVLGSVVPASQGALTVLVSGVRKAFETAKPLLENIGQNLFYLEEPGLATKMKLINNLALGSFMATIAESVAFGEKTGMTKETVLDILSAGAGNSMVLNAKKAKLQSEDFSPHFTNALIYKDLHCLQDLAYELKTPLFTASVVKDLFGKAVESGLKDQDFSSIYRVFKK